MWPGKKLSWRQELNVWGTEVSGWVGLTQVVDCPSVAVMVDSRVGWKAGRWTAMNNISRVPGNWWSQSTEKHCYRPYCVLPKFTCWNPNPIVMVLGGGAFGRWLGHDSWALTMGLVPLEEETWEGLLLCPPPGKDTRKKKIIYRPGGESSPRTKPTGT